MILAIGTVTLDTVETASGRTVHAPGGSALYFAAAACGMEVVHPVGVVGEDYPDGLLDPLEKAGIRLDGIRRLPERSQRWRVRYGAEGERADVSADRSILEGFRPTLTPLESASPVVFLGSVDPSVQCHVLGQLDEGSTRLVALDSMHHWITKRRPDLLAILGSAHVYFGTDREVQALARTPDVEASAKALLDHGPRIVVVKRGSEGALLFTGREVHAVSGEATEVVDPTGAGDAFAGGFMATLAAAGAEARDLTRPKLLTSALQAGARAGARAVADHSWRGLLSPIRP